MSDIKVGDYVTGNCEEIWMECVLDYSNCAMVWDVCDDEILIESEFKEMYWMPAHMFDRATPKWGVSIKNSHEWWNKEYKHCLKNDWNSPIVTHNGVTFIVDWGGSHIDAMVVRWVNKSKPRTFKSLKEAREFVDTHLHDFKHKSDLYFKPYR